jgi:hypothetical protein
VLEEQLAARTREVAELHQLLASRMLPAQVDAGEDEGRPGTSQVIESSPAPGQSGEPREGWDSGMVALVMGRLMREGHVVSLPARMMTFDVTEMALSMSEEDFWDLGYLQEANRRFFNPLGLCLSLDIAKRKDGFHGTGIRVLDFRDAPEGFSLPHEFLTHEENESQKKADYINAEVRRRRPAREKKLGYWVQPLPAAAATSETDQNEAAPPRRRYSRRRPNE